VDGRGDYLDHEAARARATCEGVGVRRRDVPPRGFKKKEREKVVVPTNPAAVAREEAGTGDSCAH
jgi:hypothetical protein